MTIECLECAAAIPLTAAPLLGEILLCDECGVELEITALDPLTIELAPEVQEDWGE